ncbi:ALP1-like protein [Tanacetum coccineum]
MSLRTSYGLLCSYEQRVYMNNGYPIPLEAIDRFWRKLNLSPCTSPGDDDLGCQVKVEVENVNKEFKKQSGAGKKSLQRKMKEITTASENSLNEPATQKSTGGRSSFKRAHACQAAYEASKPKVQRTPVERDRYGAHDRLVMAYFWEHLQYDEATFYDCTGHRGISSLMKCTSAICQLAYVSASDSLDEYLQMGATTARKSLQMFSKVIINLYGEEFLCKPTYTDTEKLYARHDEKHRGDHGPEPFILLEAIASNDLWIWHAFFSVSGMNNDVNVLCQFPIFNDLKSGRAADVPFVVNNVLYKRGYYLTDGIYPQWSVLIKSITNPDTHDHKRILYKTKHEAARKDVERAFGVLKLKWKLIKYPTRGMSRSKLSDVMYTCIIDCRSIIYVIIFKV